MATITTHASYASQAWTVVHYIPWIVPFAIFCVSITPRRDGKGGAQLVLKLFGMWLSVMQILLNVLQNYFNYQRNDPFMIFPPAHAFPSLKAYYWAALMTYVILFCYLYNIILGWFWWACIFLFFALPQSMLVWMLYNTWQEALVSTLLGVISTTVFLLLIRFIIQDSFPYLVNMFPFTYMSVTDTYIMTEEQQKLATAVRERMEKVRQEEWY